jgi:hypothetical protein
MPYFEAQFDMGTAVSVRIVQGAPPSPVAAIGVVAVEEK